VIKTVQAIFSGGWNSYVFLLQAGVLAGKAWP